MKPIQTGPQSLRRFLCVTAVVAGLAVGGALTGCGSSRSSLNAGHSPAVLHLGASGGRGMAAGAAADSKMMPIRPTSFVFDGTAPNLGAAAQAYTVGGQTGSAALVEQYAKAFGLTGTARELAADAGGGWQVGAADYSAPVLTAGQWGMHQWTYSTPMSATAGVSCAVASPPAGATTTMPPEKCGEPTPVPNLPTEAEAIAAAKRLLAAMGSDVAGYTFTTYASAWNVTANGTLTVGGLATDLNVSFTFGANSEVQYAGGTLGTVTPLDSYPIVSVADGVKRLADPSGPWWSFGGPVAMARAGVNVAVDTAAGSVTVNDGPTVGAPIPAPIPMPSGTIPIDVPPVSISVGSVPPDTIPTVTMPIDTTPFVVHLNGVKLVLSSVWQADGTQLLLPAFSFTSGDGSEYRVLAVDATYLDTTSTATTGTAVTGATVTSGSAVLGSGSSAGSTGSGGGSIAVPTPALGTIVLANFDDAKQLAGLPLDKATDLAKAKGWVLRVAEEDGVSKPLTDDYLPNRVNVIVKAGDVFDIMSVG